MEEEIDIKNNSDINQALKEFEVKSATEQAQRNISKKEDSDIPGMVKLVIKSSGGAVKDRRQAEWFLLILAILMILISLFLLRDNFKYFFVKTGKTTIPVGQIIPNTFSN